MNEPKEFPYTQEDIIAACNQVREGRRVSGFETKINEFENAFKDERKIIDGVRHYSADFKDIVLDWHKNAQIHAYAKRPNRTTAKAEQTAPNDVIESEPTCEVTINLSRKNLRRICSIELAGGNAHIYINRLIDNDFGE